jgi:hypothetical protein
MNSMSSRATILGKRIYTTTRAFGANKVFLLKGEYQRGFHEGCGFGCHKYAKFKEQIGHVLRKNPMVGQVGAYRDMIASRMRAGHKVSLAEFL